MKIPLVNWETLSRTLGKDKNFKDKENIGLYHLFVSSTKERLQSVMERADERQFVAIEVRKSINASSQFGFEQVVKCLHKINNGIDSVHKEKIAGTLREAIMLFDLTVQEVADKRPHAAKPSM